MFEHLLPGPRHAPVPSSEAMSEGLSVGRSGNSPGPGAVIVGTSYYQVRYQTTRRKKNDNGQSDNKQAQQMQMISKIMPLFMGFISWTFPMGLGSTSPCRTDSGSASRRSSSGWMVMAATGRMESPAR